MANPTTNFGWVMPTNTDLVTDLPADFNVFGQAVDTSMAQLKGGTTGQILSKTSATDMAFTWIANDQGDITGVTATSPLTGGGTSGAITVGIQDATTSVKGSVQLSDSTSTTSSVLAATPTAVKSAYDLAAAAVPSSTNFFAGKNKIINGDFGVWQRGTSFNTNLVYCADRFLTEFSAGTVTTSQQTFTPGTAPVAGYEGTYFLRINKTATGAGGFNLQQRIEDVRTFAGQTITLSFWAKADATVTNEPYYQQQFGTGGSIAVGAAFSTQTLTTSWARYSATVTIPSISGKTIGTNSFFQLYPIRTTDSANHIIDVWGVQLEAASTVSNFQTATGTKQNELAACQRYYWRSTPGVAYGTYCSASASSATNGVFATRNPVTMRTIPTSVEWANLQAVDYPGTIFAITAASVAISITATQDNIVCTFTSSGMANNGNYVIRNANNTAGYLGFSAEL